MPMRIPENVPSRRLRTPGTLALRRVRRRVYSGLDLASQGSGGR